MRLVFSFFLVICFHYSWAQADSVLVYTPRTYHDIDLTIEDTLLDALYDKDSLQWYINWSFQDSLKIEEGWYYQNRKVGLWIKYHENGITPKLIGMYRNNRPSGKYYKIYPNGIIREEGEFYRGNFIGEHKRYYESGCMKYWGHYNENGNENDTIRYYYDCDSSNCCETGQLEYKFYAVDGIPTGTVVLYYKSGKLKSSIIYNRDGVKEKEAFFEEE